MFLKDLNFCLAYNLFIYFKQLELKFWSLIALQVKLVQNPVVKYVISISFQP